MDYTIRNYKRIPLDFYDDGPKEDGYKVTICRDEKMIGSFTMFGGWLDIEVKVSEPERQLLMTTATAWLDNEDGPPDDIIIAQFLEHLVEVWKDKRDLQRQMKRWCKTKTIFTLKGDEEGAYRTLLTAYNPKAHAQIIRKYGEKVTGIWNKKAEKVF